MGRHSAPDDPDEDVELDDPAVDGGSNVALATAPEGRHSRAGEDRPRPTAEGQAPIEGLGLIDDALIDDALRHDASSGGEPGEVPGPVAEPLPGPMIIVDAETAEAVVLEPIDEPLAPPPGETPAAAETAETPETAKTRSAETPDSAETCAVETPETGAQDALTTEIPLADIARGDRPVPEETTAQIAPVADAPQSEAPTAATPTAATPTGHPRPHPHPAPEPGAQPEPARGTHSTRHDLALIKAHGDVRARAIAAVLVPFVVYVAVLAVVGDLNVRHLIWIFAPAIAAGVLVGVVLDAGHRRYPGIDRPRPDPVSEPADPA